jgi:hypothetical protein
MALPKSVCGVVCATAGYERSVTNLLQSTLQFDNVFGEDAGFHQVPTVTGSVTAGYVATLVAPIDTGSAPAGGGAGAGPGRRRTAERRCAPTRFSSSTALTTAVTS